MAGMEQVENTVGKNDISLLLRAPCDQFVQAADFSRRIKKGQNVASAFGLNLTLRMPTTGTGIDCR